MRQRATAVILQDNKVLLVRDKGRHHLSLPGGGFKKGESSKQAAAREIYEELGLRTLSSERLRFCDLEGRRAKHRVVLLFTTGKPYLKSKELNKFIWWDMKKRIPLQRHVSFILDKVKDRGWIT